MAGRGIERHGFAVAKIAYYRYRTQGGAKVLLVHRTAEGLITDFDSVDD